jgi:ribonuclease PH
MRHDGRQPDQLRPLELTRRFTENAPGSVLIRTGRTLVLCTASIDEQLPLWRQPSGAGWITAEYDMLPGATSQRRSRNRTRVDGRTQEIQRLIGRSLRAAVGLTRLGPRTITLDCDVLQADGGTRTAAITGAYVALCDALAAGQRRRLWSDDVLVAAVAAVSVGIVNGQPLLDLDYHEDVAAQVDGNLVMTSRGQWIEVQTTAEAAPYTEQQLAALLELGRVGIQRLLALQQEALQREPITNGSPPCPV